MSHWAEGCLPPGSGLVCWFQWKWQLEGDLELEEGDAVQQVTRATPALRADACS